MHDNHWKPRVVMMPTLSSLAAPQVVFTTTCGATNDDKVDIMKTLFSVMSKILSNSPKNTMTTPWLAIAYNPENPIKKNAEREKRRYPLEWVSARSTSMMEVGPSAACVLWIRSTTSLNSVCTSYQASMIKCSGYAYIGNWWRNIAWQFDTLIPKW